MADVQIKWRMKEFVAIANAVNEEVCVPIAERVAASVKASTPEGHPDMPAFVHVAVDPRSGLRDWAHATVINAYPGAMTLESRHGLMKRALG